MCHENDFLTWMCYFFFLKKERKVIITFRFVSARLIFSLASMNFRRAETVNALLTSTTDREISLFFKYAAQLSDDHHGN